MRVWFLKSTPSIDVNCGTGCNIDVWTRGNEIYRITPRENNEVNSAWMPDSHRLAFHKFQNEHRLTAPLIAGEDSSSGKVHSSTSMTNAIEAAAKGFKGLEGHKIAIVASARCTNEEILLLKKIKEALGAKNLVLIARNDESDGKLMSADRNPNTTGAKLVLGDDNPFDKYDPIKEGINSGEIEAALIVGEDLTESGFSTDELSKLKHLVVLNILSNATAGRAHVVLPGASFAEKRGSMVNVTGRLQRLNRAILPPGEALPDWEILSQLLTAISPEAPAPQKIQDVFGMLAQEIKEFADLTLQKIGDLGVPITDTGVTIPLLEKEKERVKSGQIVG